ncbi:hypothetical protein ACIQK6_38590 [Streptomyces sp. NPDC091682]|uniref:hypothetical protein n=1 Tax=Streptomyces sp. NPDC091682 TaxID=3366005 RepID=UPI00381B43A3
MGLWLAWMGVIAMNFAMKMAAEFCWGISFLAVVSLAAEIISAGFNYIRSGGSSEKIARAKKTIIFGIYGVICASVVGVVVQLAYQPTLVESMRGVILAGAVALIISQVFFTNFVPRMIAAYSSWWVPKAERSAHREDIFCALIDSRGLERSRHIWQEFASGPRAGLRSRRYHVRLAVVTSNAPSHSQVRHAPSRR